MQKERVRVRNDIFTVSSVLASLTSTIKGHFGIVTPFFQIFCLVMLSHIALAQKWMLLC